MLKKFKGLTILSFILVLQMFSNTHVYANGLYESKVNCDYELAAKDNIPMLKTNK